MWGMVRFRHHHLPAGPRFEHLLVDCFEQSRLALVEQPLRLELGLHHSAQLIRRVWHLRHCIVLRLKRQNLAAPALALLPLSPVVPPDEPLDVDADHRAHEQDRDQQDGLVDQR
jgi:hypothetical protein